MQDEPKHRKREAEISARVFKVSCNKRLSNVNTENLKSWTQHILLFHLQQHGEFLHHLENFTPNS